MKILYLLTEADSDDLFYEACAQRVTGETFTPVSRRMRKGSGIDAVCASIEIALHEVSRMANGSGVHFLVAKDNDRAPHATAADALPTHQRALLTQEDSSKQDRYAELLVKLEAKLGKDQSKWNVPVAIAVPVEMIETWLLLIANGGHASDLPRFSRSDKHAARHFYQPTQPPPQLKDLYDLACAAAGVERANEWMLSLIFERLDPEDLAARSPSFNLFKQWLDLWPKVPAEA